MSKPLIIEDKCREMIMYGYVALKQFPRSEKHGLAAEIRSSMWSVQRIKTKLKKFRKQFAAGEISLQEINPKLQSWFGHASHANTANLRNAIFQKPFRRDS